MCRKCGSELDSKDTGRQFEECNNLCDK